MNIKLLNSMAVAALLSVGLAKGQSISYTTTKDDPDMRNLSVALNVIDFAAYSPNMSIAYNVYAHARLGKLLIADFDFRRSYNDASMGSGGPVDIGKGFQTRIGGRFNLVNTTKSGKAKVVLSSYTSGNYRHTTFINVPATYRKIFSVRGGLQNIREVSDISSMAGSDEDFVMYYKDANGVKQELRDQFTYASLAYTCDAIGFYGGLSFQSIVNVIINAEGYGKRSRSIANDFYIDGLLTPLVNYSLVPNVSQKAAYGKVDINISENSRRYIGWRFGWQAFMGRKVGFTTKMEFGQQPGIGANPWFVTIGMGLGIGANIPGLTKFGNKK